MWFSARFGLAAFLALVLLPALRAQSAQFEVSHDGHTVGVASFEFNGAPTGYESSSMVRIEMPGLEYSLSKHEQLTAADQLRSVVLSTVTNSSAVSVACTPKRAQILLDFSANGKSSTTKLTSHGVAVFLPDFDPGALETLLALAVAQNNRDLWAILPKNSGSIEPVELTTYPDQQGTLDGEALAVHHMVATIAGAKTNLFSGPDNQLLQAELPQEGFVLVRKGFVLQPSAKPEAPAQ
ncbi:MAG TPA: hypothetical protein VHD85_13190 [Terracidiphilus sp.]|jgi:hypothetical protein|nr:hypothetical protein [Terracidiphilus sp.]